MNKLAETVAFIPVRGGSKSIPLKNIKKINGRPLIYWVLDATVECEEIDKVVVSTDSNKISEVVNDYNSEKIKIIDRSKEVSTDTASTESVMLEFANNYNFKDIILVQATSPLLDAKDLSKGLKKYRKKDTDSILSVVRQKRFIWEDQGSEAKPVNYNYNERPRRQEFDGFLVENGSFYITSKKRLVKYKSRISGNIKMVEMDEETYFEIDEPTDWVIVEKLLKQKYGKKNIKDIKFDKIKCVLSDSDGVLTDGGMYYSENGDELKKFNTKDGKGFELLRKKGYITGIITGENIDLVKRRAEKLQLDEVFLGVKDKIAILDEICNKYDLKYENIAYIGDDINDLEIMKHVGLSFAVNNAIDSVKEVSDYVTLLNGGDGAVREFIEFILKKQTI
jgi:N-acylneuraminate cytidylyltransferase